MHIYNPGHFSVDVPVKADAPRFRFTMPDVRPGPAKLGLHTTYMEARPKVSACSGTSRCEAHASTTTGDIELVVIAK